MLICGVSCSCLIWAPFSMCLPPLTWSRWRLQQTLVADETTLDIYGTTSTTGMNTVMRLAFVPGATCIERTRWARTAPCPSSTWSGGRPVIAQDPGLAPSGRHPLDARGAPCSSPGDDGWPPLRDVPRPRPPRLRPSGSRPGRRSASHEGIEASGNGSVFVIDELNGGSVYDKGRKSGPVVDNAGGWRGLGASGGRWDRS